MRRPFRAVAAAAAVVLVGCAVEPGSPPAPEFSDLDRDPNEGRPLSPELAAADPSLDVGSVRWVGEYDGADVWIAADPEGDGMCVVVVPRADDGSGTAGCGTSGVAFSRDAVPTVGIVADNEDPQVVPPGATRLSENVWAWGEE